MAESSAATQSPSVSSSSSGAEPSTLGGGGGSPGACPALGAKSCGSSCAVHDLIFWRDVKKTGFVFGTTLIMLLSLAAFSVISVVSYLILALLSVTISFRVYKSVIQAVQKSEEGHPFKAYLDVDITLSSEAFHSYMNAAMVHVNKALKLIIRLFLVEDLVDSLKLAVFMWLMTYVGAVFNGITLLILAELLVFSVPIVYEKLTTMLGLPGIRPSQLLKRSKQSFLESPKKRQNKHMEARSATVTKTPFNSYNIVTCTMKELAQCQLEFGSKLFVLFNLVFSPILSLYPQYQAQDVLD
uniref:Reticulon n=1 Tax=Rattus norvegicus TaxID=10116 RepID=A0A0H2UHX1_RAT